MKRKIFSILFALVLVLSLSLVTAVPAAAATNVVLGGGVASLAGAQSSNAEQYLGTGSWQSISGDAKIELYLVPSLPPYDAELGTFTIADIQSIAYRTKNDGLQSGLDFYINIYTMPYTGGDSSWYGNRVTLEPLYANSYNAPASTWNEWTTDSGPNQLTFFDSNHGPVGFYGAPTLADIQLGPIDWSAWVSGGDSTSIDYRDQEVKYIVLATGNPWASAFVGNVDALVISLNSGGSVTIDLEHHPSEVWVDDDWAGTMPGVDPDGAGSATSFGYDAFATIQEGIDAVSGSTINVAAGTYVEDLNIPATKANLELTSASGASVTKIKGVAVGTWPTHVPGIDVRASGVKIHGFTIESPDYQAGEHSSGIIVGATNVEIYENTFVITDDSSGNGWGVSIETYGQWAGDVSGLNIHNNTFTSTTGTDKGSEGIYINYNKNNPTPAGTVTIANNTFGGQIWRAITTERSKTTISGNTISSSYAPHVSGNPFTYSAALRGIDISSPTGNLNPTQDTVLITGNSVTGFYQGILLGASANILTNIRVTNNTVGMNTTGIKVRSTAGGVVVNYNNISGNTAYGVDNIDTANALDATNNWWGDCSGPSGAGPGTGDSVSANVLFDPWLGKNLNGLRTAIVALSTDDDFTKPKAASGPDGQKQALLDKIDAVCDQFGDGSYRGALNKLERDLMKRIEKWINDPPAPGLIDMVGDEIDILLGFLP